MAMKKLIHIPQSYRTWASPSDNFVSYQANTTEGESFLSAVMVLASSTAPTDGTLHIFKLCNFSVTSLNTIVIFPVWTFLLFSLYDFDRLNHPTQSRIYTNDYRPYHTQLGTHCYSLKLTDIKIYINIKGRNYADILLLSVFFSFFFSLFFLSQPLSERV